MGTSSSRLGSGKSLAAGIFLLAAGASCAVPSASHAQDLYYRSIPLGERAIGLGGAYTGIADDASGTYYNPAGLTTGGRFSLLGSLSSLVFTRQTVEQAFDSPDVDRDFTSKGTTTLPHFVGTVVRLGKEKKRLYGERPFAVAYSSFELSRDRFGAGFSEVLPEASADLSLSSNYRMRWFGVSFAMQLKKKVSVGLSAFVARQSFAYNDDIGLAAGGTLDERGVRIGGDSVTSRTGIGYNAWSFVFRLGALYRINERWQLGLMFQPPGAPIKETGNVYRRFVGDVGGESSYFLLDKGDLSTRVPIPWELRAGVEHKINESTTLSIDAAIAGPIRNRKIFEPPAELADFDVRLGAYFANSTERRWTPNFAIGAEHLFSKFFLAGGLFTNLSAAPDVPETSTEYTPDQISTFGASIAVGVDTEGYRFALGATGLFGRGDALAFTVDREARVTGYVRTKSNRSAILVYIAGAVSVGSQASKDVQTKYKERKARKDADRGENQDAVDAGPDEPDETKTEPTEAESEAPETPAEPAPTDATPSQ